MSRNRYINEDGEFIVRASALGNCMASPNKTELSAGAKTYVKTAFKETYLNYSEELDLKQLDKGIVCENEAIKIVSKFYNEPYVKNEDRFTNGYIKGECDIAYKDKIRDIKCSWSKKTHPLTPEDAKSTKYEWQGRAYMMLWDKNNFYLDYVLMNTPDHLVPKYEDYELHRGCEDLSLELRITTIHFERDYKKESQIIQRVNLMRDYWNSLKKQFNIKNK